jgi:hypothetical protein
MSSQKSIQATGMVSLEDAPPSTETLGSLSLVSSHEIDSINLALNEDFSRMAAELHHVPEPQLKARLRQYDGYQRMTFGRALTGLVSGEDGLYRLAETDFKHCTHSEYKDASFFPRPFTKKHYPGVWAALQYSVRMHCTSPIQSDPVMVTIFCHRVLVRPGEVYSGFMHRDLPQEAGGRIGTVIWYPRVDGGNMVGAHLFSYNIAQTITLEKLAAQLPDYVFAPSVYKGKVMFLAYPNNYPHGVRPGCNQTIADVHCPTSLNDFLQPRASFFVKDMFILAVSERSPVEE